jgi:hypothetical protein
MAGHGPGPVDPHFDPADPEYGLTPEGSTYEHTDAHTWIIAKFMFWLAVTAVLTHVGLGFMYQMLIEQGQRREEGEIRYPLAREQQDRLPPAPRLQQFPSNEIYDFRLKEQAELQGYAWQSREQGTVRIPITEAMRLTVERGLPSRAQDAAAPAATDPGLIPSDASAGRMLERRRQ